MKNFWLIVATLLIGMLSNQLSAFDTVLQHYHPHFSQRVEDKILDFAQHNLPQRGVLLENKEGYTYLKVDDGYIHQLFPMLENKKYQKPAYFRRKDSPGAHISVMYIDERGKTGPVKEIGKVYTFKLKKIEYVPDHTLEYIVITVEAPELEALRTKYGLAPLLKGHEFHITIAKKKPYYRYN